MSSINLQSPIIREITAELSMGSFAARAAMVLVAIALLTLTFAALETYLSGDESLSALEAAMTLQPN